MGKVEPIDRTVLFPVLSPRPLRLSEVIASGRSKAFLCLQEALVATDAAAVIGQVLTVEGAQSRGPFSSKSLYACDNMDKKVFPSLYRKTESVRLSSSSLHSVRGPSERTTEAGVVPRVVNRLSFSYMIDA